MIIKWYEIVCDYCGNAEHFRGTIQSAEEQYKSTSGIVCKNKNTIVIK